MKKDNIKKCEKEIDDICKEHFEYNWDGYNALPITIETGEAAKEFIRLIPNDIDIPEFSPDNDGEISIDWDYCVGDNFNSEYFCLSVSINDGKKLSYVMKDPYNRSNGIYDFKDKIPEPIIKDLKTFLKNKEKKESK